MKFVCWEAAYGWMTYDQIKDHYKGNDRITKAITQKKLRQGPDYFQAHPEVPELEEAMLFKVYVHDLEINREGHDARQRLSMNADLDRAGAQVMLGNLGWGPQSSGMDRSAGQLALPPPGPLELPGPAGHDATRGRPPQLALPGPPAEPKAAAPEPPKQKTPEELKVETPK